MRKIISMTIMGVLILCSGCIRSLHPIYTEQDIVFEAGLIGQWSEEGSKELWVFSKDGPNSYELVYTDDKGREGRFKARLVKIGGSLFLDLFPGEREAEENDYYEIHFLPVHTFLHVKRIEPTLQMRFPDPGWLKKFLAGNPDAIRHDSLDGEIILTAQTKDMQAFWLQHLNTEGAFEESGDLKRR